MDEIQTLPEFEVIFITSVDENIAILQSVICTIIVPVSLLLIYGIVHYEHFGVDPQKRSFFNKSIGAQTCATTAHAKHVDFLLRAKAKKKPFFSRITNKL